MCRKQRDMADLILDKPSIDDPDRISAANALQTLNRGKSVSDKSRSRLLLPVRLYGFEAVRPISFATLIQMVEVGALREIGIGMDGRLWFFNYINTWTNQLR